MKKIARKIPGKPGKVWRKPVESSTAAWYDQQNRKDAFYGCDQLTVYAPRGSFAEKAAREQELTVAAL